MGDKTAIEWADATWNPVVGCSKVSPGCDHCYAIRTSYRMEAMGQDKYAGLTVKADGALDWTGEVRLAPEALDQPLRWTKPRKIFVNSQSDLFHPGLSDEVIAQVFAVMALAPQHTFQVLTKRPQRMAEWFAYDFLGENQQVIVQEAVTALTRKLGWPRPVIFDGRMVNPEASTSHGRLADDPNYDRRAPLTWPLPNVWLGTSIESDRYAFRADHLRRTPAVVRFISAEPLLGPLPSLDLTGIDWVIVGGESGPGARPMHPSWVREIRDKCIDVDTEPFQPDEPFDSDSILVAEDGVDVRVHLGETKRGLRLNITQIKGAPSFLFKQWGAWCPPEPECGQSVFDYVTNDDRVRLLEYGGTLRGTPWPGWKRDQPDGHVVRRYGKKAAGRVLDGLTWTEFPDEE